MFAAILLNERARLTIYDPQVKRKQIRPIWNTLSVAPKESNRISKELDPYNVTIVISRPLRSQRLPRDRRHDRVGRVQNA